MSRREKAKPPSKVETSDVRHLAELSRLTLSSREEEEMRADLDEILGYFAKLDGAKAEGLEPTLQTIGSATFREDVPIRFDFTKIDAGVPKRKGRLVRAPRVF